VNDIDKLKDELVLACKIAANEGLVPGFGHISVRIPETDRFLITRMVALADAKKEDVLTVDLNGRKVEGEGDLRGEVWLHTCIYRARPDVGSVSHVHPEYTIILGCTGTKIQPLHNVGAMFPEGVEIYHRAGHIHTEELGTEVAHSLGKSSALMLRGHGAVVVGPDVMQATLLSIYLEEAARIQYRASLLGNAWFFSEEESQAIKELIYSPRLTPSVWQYYANKIARKSGA